MSESTNGGSPQANGIEDLLNLVNALNPLANGVKAVDQAKRTVEALIASMELFVQSMDNLNQVATRVNRLLDDIEGPVRQIAPHINGALSASVERADKAPWAITVISSAKRTKQKPDNRKLKSD